MDPSWILQTSGDALSLVSALATLIKETRQTKNENLSALLARLQIDAVRVSSEIETRLLLLNERLRELGLDPNKSLESQIEDLSWYNWIRRAQINHYSEEFNGAFRQLSSFIDDATALMLCEGSHEGNSGLKTVMFAAANRKKKMLYEVIMDPGRTIGSMLQSLLSAARDVTEELRAA